MFSTSSILNIIISLIDKVIELIAEWRQNSGDQVAGVGNLGVRVEYIVKSCADMEFPDLTSEEANAQRMKAALKKMRQAGICLPERVARYFIEGALVKEMLAKR